MLSLRALEKHIGHHQEQLALFALPPNLEATEDDQQEVDSDNVVSDLIENDIPNRSAKSHVDVDQPRQYVRSRTETMQTRDALHHSARYTFH